MTATDLVLAIVSMTCFVGFVAIVGSFVLEPDLIIVLVVGVTFGIVDFVRTFRRRASRS